MVSGFVTSPNDQERISSGEAILIWMKSKSAERCSLDLGKSIIVYSSWPRVTLRPRACSSFTSTLNDSGIPGWGRLSPFTMAS